LSVLRGAPFCMYGDATLPEQPLNPKISASDTSRLKGSVLTVQPLYSSSGMR
jgi:hypothetical protein